MSISRVQELFRRLLKRSEPEWPQLVAEKDEMKRQLDEYTRKYRNSQLPYRDRAHAAEAYVREAPKLVRHAATMATAGGRTQSLEDYDPRLVAIMTAELGYIAKHFKRYPGCYEGVVVIIRSPHFPERLQGQVLFN